MRISIQLLAAILGVASGATMLIAADLPPAPPKSFQRDVLPILRTNCMVCHQDQVAMGGLTLLPAGAYANLVGSPSAESAMQRVVPGNPDHSYLIRKVEGTHAAVGGKGVMMPIGSTLAPVEIRTLRQWVLEGASNN
jgi:hypothetical protein